MLPPQTDHEPGGVPYTGRFAALIDDTEVDPTIEDTVTIGESDTDTIDGQSEADPEASDEVEPLGLDEVDLNTIFARREIDLPLFLKGPYRAVVE